MTNNGSNTITIPAGSWNASLALRSEPVATLLKSINPGVDMIFHFEDGVGVDPDNSEGDNNRDLDACGVKIQFKEKIQASADDAEQKGSSVDIDGTSDDFELVYDGSFQHIGLRWSMDVPQGATITKAEIKFEPKVNSAAASPDIIIGAEDVDNASAFAEVNNNISDRWGSVTTLPQKFGVAYLHGL